MSATFDYFIFCKPLLSFVNILFHGGDKKMNKKAYICILILMIIIFLTLQASAREPDVFRDNFRIYSENPLEWSKRGHDKFAVLYEAMYSLDEVFTLGEEYTITRTLSLTDDGTWGDNNLLVSAGGTVTIEGKYDIHKDVYAQPTFLGTLTYNTTYLQRYEYDREAFEHQYSIQVPVRIDNNGDWARLIAHIDENEAFSVRLDAQIIPIDPDEEEPEYAEEEEDEEYLWKCYICFEEVERQSSGVGFNDLHGEVYVHTTCPLCGEVDDYFAELTNILYMGDLVETRANSGVILSLRDMTTFTMRPGSTIRIGDTSGPQNRLSLLMGHVWVNVERMLADGTLDVEMSQAAAGARGTIFTLEETGDKSIIKVMQGAVEITTNSGESYMLYPGQMIEVTEYGTDGAKLFPIDDEIAAWPEEYREEIKAALLQDVDGGLSDEDIEKAIGDYERHQKQKSFIPFVIVVIVAACLGGYLYYRKTSK